MSTDASSTGAEPVESAPAESGSGFDKSRLMIGIALAAVVAWGGLSFLPLKSEMPEELQGVDMYSPQELQEQAAVEEPLAKWRTAMIQLGFAGACFGLIPPLFLGWGSNMGRMVTSAGIGLLLGAGLGAAAGHLGIELRKYFDAEHFESGLLAEPMMRDAVMFMMCNLLITLPLAVSLLLTPDSHRFSRASAVVLGGLLGGLLLPLTSVAVPSMTTHEFAPTGLPLLTLWFGLLAGGACAMAAAIGDKEKATASAEPEASAS